MWGNLLVSSIVHLTEVSYPTLASWLVMIVL